MKCLTPVQIRNPNYPNNRVYMDVPCGKCAICLQNRANQWKFRIQQELKSSTSAFFVTLTYDDEHLPVTDDGLLTVSKRDCQLFFKRLRKSLSLINANIRYFLVSEYGGKSFRPHYHLILFNFPFKDVDINKTLNQSWQQGFVHIGEVTPQSISYCCQYILGNIVQTYEKDRKPFMLSSRRPAIGRNFCDSPTGRYVADNMQPYIMNDDGYKVSIPRYYKDKLFNEQQLEIIKQEHEHYQANQKSQEIKRYGGLENYYRYTSSAAQAYQHKKYREYYRKKVSKC